MAATRTISVAAFMALVGGIIFLFMRESLFATRAPGIALQIGAVVLMLWARWTFGRRSFHPAADPTAGELITSGPYRFLRHPIYAAIVYFSLAAIACHPSWQNALAGLVIITAVVVRALCEEAFLIERYPTYLAYAARTKRLVPYIY